MTSPATILIVDDQPEIVELASTILENEGYRVLTATNGLSGLAALERNEVDLLFTDIVMPGGISGFDLAQKARAMRPGLNIVYMSGYLSSTPHSSDDFREARLLPKPWRASDLTAVIERSLAAAA
jgi:CheY-like chemotaxis protein